MKTTDVIRTDVHPAYVTRWWHRLAFQIGLLLYYPARTLLRFGVLPEMWRQAARRCAAEGLEADGIEVTVRITVQHHLMNPRAAGKGDEVIN
jgi:hypothetical protein